MALTDAQLDDVKSKMELGITIRQTILDDYPSEKLVEVRGQLNAKFTQPVIREIMQSKIMPQMLPNMSNVLSRMVQKMGKPEATVESIDEVIAELQSTIVSLEVRKVEIEEAT